MKRVFVAALVAALIVAYYRRRATKRVREVVMVVSRGQETPEEEAAVSRMVKEGRNYFERNVVMGKLHGRGNLTLQYGVLRSNMEDEKGLVLFLPGWSESMIKYADFLKELNELGYTVVALDHRSQGYSSRSPRTLVDEYDHIKTHVEDFHDLLTDALLVYHEVALPLCLDGKSFKLMGFSIGGLVATHLSTMIKCDSLILVSPCLQPLIGAYPPWLLQLLTRALRALGRGEHFFPGPPPEKSFGLLMPPHSRVSSSSARVRYWQGLREEQSVLCVNGMSVAQFDEILGARPTPQSARRVLAKQVLLLSAELERFVENEAIFRFADHLPSHITCRHVHIRGAKHELLQEREEIRGRALDEIKAFL